MDRRTFAMLFAALQMACSDKRAYDEKIIWLVLGVKAYEDKTAVFDIYPLEEFCKAGRFLFAAYFIGCLLFRFVCLWYTMIDSIHCWSRSIRQCGLWR